MKCVRRCVINNERLRNIVDEKINNGDKRRGGTIDNTGSQVNHKKWLIIANADID